MPAARRAATRLLKNVSPEKGFVTLVAAGSGEADLLTLRAVRALQETDLVLHDERSSARTSFPWAAAMRERVPFETSALTALAPALAANFGEAKRAVVLAAGSSRQFAVLAATLEAAGVAFSVIPGVEGETSAPTRSVQSSIAA